MVLKVSHHRLLNLIIAGIVIVFGFFLNSCQSNNKGADYKPVISISILPHQYFVKEIAGDDFTINVLLPPGMNHHAYEPTPRQLIELERSGLLLVNGYLPFEDKFIEQAHQFPEKTKVAKTTDGVSLIYDDPCEVDDGHQDNHSHGVDPHTWLSLVNAKAESLNILKALCEINPSQSNRYKENQEKLVVKLDSLHSLFKQKISLSGVTGFMIYHPALGYVARDYGLRQLAIEKLGKNPTPYELRVLIDNARQLKFRTIFIQKEFDRENAEIIARETGARIVEINPLSDDWLSNLISILNEIQSNKP